MAHLQTMLLHLHTFAAALCGGASSSSIVDTSCLPTPSTDSGRIQVILSAVFGTLGAICLLVITIAGFRYVVSHGDPNVIAQAKQTILYALIGLIICLSAIAIVSFVVGRL